MEPIETPLTSVVEWFWAAPDEALFSQKDLVAVTGMSDGFFERARWAGTGPPFLKIGGGHLVRYQKGDAVSWIKQNPPVASTSETLAQPVGSPRPSKKREPTPSRKPRATKVKRRVATRPPLVGA